MKGGVYQDAVAPQLVRALFAVVHVRGESHKRYA